MGYPFVGHDGGEVGAGLGHDHHRPRDPGSQDREDAPLLRREVAHQRPRFVVQLQRGRTAADHGDQFAVVEHAAGHPQRGVLRLQDPDPLRVVDRPVGQRVHGGHRRRVVEAHPARGGGPTGVRPGRRQPEPGCLRRRGGAGHGGHDRGTRLGHRPERGDQLGARRHGDRDAVAGPDALGDEIPGPLRRPAVEVEVGDLNAVRDERRGLGIGLHGDLPLLRHRPLDAVGDRHRLGLDDRGRRALGLGADVDVPDHRVGGFRDGAQDGHEAFGERRDGAGVEQVHGVGEPDVHAGGRAARVLTRIDGHLQVELRGEFTGVEGLDGETRQFEARGLGVLERQHRLEHGMPGRGAHGHHVVDHPLERHVGVPERLEVDGAGPVEQLGEGRRRVHIRAQGEGVDEHPDEVVEAPVTAARDGRADDDVVGAAEPGEQHGERRVDDHEQRRPVLEREGVEPLPDLRVDLHRHRAAAQRRLRRPGPVRGQIEQFGHPGQARTPVGQLGTGRRLRIVGVTEDPTLPERVVGVLHLERRPGRRAARQPRRVGGHQIPCQRRQRRTVGGDVVDDEGEHVVVGADRDDPAAHRHLRGDVEALGGEGDDLGERLLLGRHLDRHDRGHHRVGVEDVLVGPRLVLRVPGAQRLVPLDHVAHRGGERRGVEAATQPDRERDVVARGGGIELVEHPHALLGERERHPIGAGPGGQRGPGRRFRVRVGPGREFGDGRCLEQFADREGGSERLVDPRDHPRRDERVAAELEERVVRTGPLDAEHVGEHLRDGAFGGGGRFAAPARGGGGRLRHRQGAPVELAVDGERQLVEDDHEVRNHVAGEEGTELLAHAGHVDVRAGAGHDVADEPVAETVVADHGDRLGHRVGTQQRRLDLAQLDAEAPQLHLRVAAPGVLELAVGVPPRDVAGAIQPARPEGVGDEPRGGQSRPTEVAAGELVTGDVHLARHPDRDGLQPPVEHPQPQPRQGAADPAGGTGARGAAVEGQERHVNRGLGDAVHVDQRRRHGPAPVPAVELAEVERLAAEHDVSQCERIGVGTLHGRDPVGLVELKERRGGLVEHGDPLGPQQLEELFGRA
ncbi:hypothetical protein [Rhodococcus sp. M8]|uniref:hypothetical protein n=1 Tax=Rhodococcus sp. M8 TaxID=1925550 RepID=UPI003FA3B4D0